jgi:endonuclease/exonuclease/phosphatase (EEP) superfamily protein YafD
VSSLFGTAVQNRHWTGARRYRLIWFLVAPLVAWAFVRVFGFDRGFPLAPLMAFTPYVAIAAFLVAGVALALRNWAAAGVAGLITFVLAAAVLPRTIGDGTVDPDGHETLTVLSTNIHHGTADPAVVIALVDRYDPDLLSVQELTPSFAAELRDGGLGGRLPHSVLETHRNTSGAGLYSRFELRKLPGPQRFVFRMPRARLTLPDGRHLRVVGIHPFPPQLNRAGEWEESLESLPSSGTGVPWLLAGDFNATLDQSQLRDLLDRGYRDAGAVAGKGLQPTFPREGHLIPPVTIDHVLADSRLGIVDYGVEELPGSDHRSIHAELALPWTSG